MGRRNQRSWKYMGVRARMRIYTLTNTEVLTEDTYLLYILWDDWLIFMISSSNEQLQHQLEYTLLKPDCHSWWILKKNLTWGHFRRTIYNKILFYTWKNATDTYRMLQTAFGHLGWIEHQFLSSKRDSRKAWRLWVMMRGVGGVRKSID